MIRPQFTLDLHDELIVDNFAGGGGASTGIELALGRCVDIAINHDREALKMHSANHPQTLHLCEDVFEVDPVAVTKGRRVGLLWLSPDCKHFSKAKGGKPREKRIRGLAWVAYNWITKLRRAGLPPPRVIILENVEEFQTWGPVFADGTINPAAISSTFRAYVGGMRRRGATALEWRELRACDYGAPTIRKRLFLIARFDGRPIVWPEPTHGDPKSEAVKSGKLKPWRTAAECIDWERPCPSIFERKRPLAEATCRRIARGIMRYVVNCADPFIVNTRNGERPGQAPRTRSTAEPFWTVTGQGSQGAIVAPVVTEHANATSPRSWSPEQPLRTQCAQVKGGHFALVQAFLAQHNNHQGKIPSAGRPLAEPMSTVTAKGSQQGLVTAHVTKFRTGSTGTDMREPLHTVTAGPKNNPAGAAHAMGVVTAHVTKFQQNGCGQDARDPMHTAMAGAHRFAEVRAFLVKYYGTEQDPNLRSPLHTVTTKDRFGLVTIHGEEFAIVDIGLRMLAPRELFRAQGFPDSYIIGDNPKQGLDLAKDAQVRMCGNSVCPPVAAALVRANVPELSAWDKIERKERVA